MSEDLPEGRILRAFGGGRTVRLVVVEARGPAEKARFAHGLGSGAAIHAAEGMIATALMSAHIKGEERLTVQIQTDRPKMAFIAEVDAEGALRARLTPSDMPHASQLSGFLHAIKSEGTRETYRGTTSIADENLERALSEHLGNSQQTSAYLRLAARLNEEGAVRFAAGILVERLPEHDEYPWIDEATFEATYGSLMQADMEDLLTAFAFGQFAGQPVELLETRDLTWKCRCSQAKVEVMLGSLGADELRAMRDEGKAEVICHFCNQAWVVSQERLTELLQLYMDN